MRRRYMSHSVTLVPTSAPSRLLPPASLPMAAVLVGVYPPRPRCLLPPPPFRRPLGNRHIRIKSRPALPLAPAGAAAPSSGVAGWRSALGLSALSVAIATAYRPAHHITRPLPSNAAPHYPLAPAGAAAFHQLPLTTFFAYHTSARPFTARRSCSRRALH
ncbi:hypothetical protein R3P38DRAFT_3173728 [Favolaschia claudopus]|uniref:Uncharacterized protein n=1 Tax=Favolaschia claudopus TaxID=2862362 RepID=A0AAW0DFW4_9AGAR